MAEYRYRILNVFTRSGRLSGNPLCVFEDGRGLSDADMQALALQFNLSETTFILPSDEADAKVRIFTPAYEMPFAGHPTLGTAYVVSDLSGTGAAMKLEMKAGVIPVAFDGERWELCANAPRWREVSEPMALIADMLGLPASAIGARPLWVHAGKEQLVIPLKRVEQVQNVAMKSAPFWQLKSEDGQSMAYVFAEQDAQTIVARFFFPKAPAILEDAATGSACANLGGWFVATGAGAVTRTVLQGDQIARPSTLHLRVTAEKRIFVGGSVIELGRGSIKL